MPISTFGYTAYQGSDVTVQHRTPPDNSESNTTRGITQEVESANQSTQGKGLIMNHDYCSNYCAFCPLQYKI